VMLEHISPCRKTVPCLPIHTIVNLVEE
jgi:hypothetical protein